MVFSFILINDMNYKWHLLLITKDGTMAQFDIKKVTLITLTGLSLLSANSWATPEITFSTMSPEGNLVSCSENFGSCVITLNASLPNTPKSLFVRNNSNRVVHNIVASFPPGYTDIRQNNQSCRTLPPKGSCNINLRPTLNVTHLIPTTAFVSGVGTTVDTFTLIVLN